MNDFSKLIGYKINIQKCAVVLSGRVAEQQAPGSRPSAETTTRPAGTVWSNRFVILEDRILAAPRRVWWRAWYVFCQFQLPWHGSCHLHAPGVACWSQRRATRVCPSEVGCGFWWLLSVGEWRACRLAAVSAPTGASTSRPWENLKRQQVLFSRGGQTCKEILVRPLADSRGNRWETWASTHNKEYTLWYGYYGRATEDGSRH